MTTAIEYAEQHAARFRDELFEFLRMKSISTDAKYQGNVRETADWLVAHLNEIGFSARLIEVEGQHPLVYADWMDAGEDAPTILIYGHYDVQPAVREDGWDTEPFEPVERDGKIYARGATDDKGQVFAQIKALEALLKSDGKLPVNVKLMIEGEEESGGKALSQFMETQFEMLTADATVISDTSMQHIDQPVIINGLRGVVAFQVTVTGPKQDLHSGMYGGTVHNPLQALAEIIAQLHKDDGSVAIPGFYDDVRQLTVEEREQIAEMTWDHVDWSEETGAPVPWGEDEFTLRERVGARPTLEINGMAGGYFEAGIKAIVPHKAWAKMTCRLVADQDPQDILDKVEKYLERITPPTVTLTFEALGIGGSGVLINTDNPAMQAAIRAYENGWGAKPVFRREGGSIPFVAELQQQLGMPVIMMGFGLNTDNLHAPNEHFSLEMFHRGIRTAIHFLQEAATIKQP